MMPYPFAAEYVRVVDEDEPFEVALDAPTWNGKPPFPVLPVIPHVQQLADHVCSLLRERGRRPRHDYWTRGIGLLMIFGPRAGKGTFVPDPDSRPTIRDVRTCLTALFREYESEPGEAFDWRAQIGNGGDLQRHWLALRTSMEPYWWLASGDSIETLRRRAWDDLEATVAVVRARGRDGTYYVGFPRMLASRFESAWRYCYRALLDSTLSVDRVRAVFDAHFDVVASARTQAGVRFLPEDLS